MCCLTQILLSILHSFSRILADVVVFMVAVIILKLLYTIIFPNQRRKKTGYGEQWFGKGPAALSTAEDPSIRPFKIEISDDVLKDLNSRLENTRFEDPVEDSKFQYGFNPNYLKQVVDYWRKEYDWRKQEKILNQVPQFKTRIEGLDIHFLHVKPNIPEGSELRILPLMVIHGWPGSVVEFYKIIPLLTTPRPGHDYVFEVICPSIPGFGFSESPHHKGFTARAAARVFVKLMERLGHRKFYVQGGDWGSFISHIMARYYPLNIQGMHLNMFFGRFTPWEAIKFVVIAFFPFLISEEEYKVSYPIKKILYILYEEFGYFHIQSTKPDTLGCSMADNPAGMAAYLLEKFASGLAGRDADPFGLSGGETTHKVTMDELLTNVMLYWVNNNFTAAARFYKENSEYTSRAEFSKVPVLVPSAIAVFPREILMPPRTCTSEQLKNLISYKLMPRGGHFAALEEPELLTDDVWKFVSVVERRR